MKRGYVYMLANKPYGTLYLGVTSNLSERVFQHKQGIASAFTKKYRVNMLVWFEEYERPGEAIQRETSMKRWKRDWKIDLVNKANPDWRDLYETGGLP